MLVYLVRRTLLSLMVFVLAAFVCFLVIQLFPGDYYTPLELYAPQLGLTQEFVDQLRTAHGLDKPMIVQFGLWLGRAFTGDFGYSVRLRAPVRTVIFRRGGELQNSAIVSGTAMLLAFGVGIPLGMLFANHRLRGIYYAFSLFTFPLLALPASYLGLLIQWAVYRWIDPMMVGPGMYGMCAPEFAGQSMTLSKLASSLVRLGPVWLLVGAPVLVTVIRILRSSVMEQQSMAYVEVARAKGLSQRQVRVHHVLRNAINPVLSLVGLVLPSIIVGEILAARFFGIRSFGYLMLHAARSQDPSLLTACILFYTLLLVGGSLATDVLLAWADPRIRYD